jgi:hypothetical protein
MWAHEFYCKDMARCTTGSLAQSSGPPSDREVMDPDEVLVSRIALSELVASQEPNRIFFAR